MAGDYSIKKGMSGILSSQQKLPLDSPDSVNEWMNNPAQEAFKQAPLHLPVWLLTWNILPTLEISFLQGKLHSLDHLKRAKESSEHIPRRVAAFPQTNRPRYDRSAFQLQFV